MYQKGFLLLQKRMLKDVGGHKAARSLLFNI